MDTRHDDPPSPPPAGAPPRGGRPEPLSAGTLERVRDRDPQALSLFFEFYFERVYGLALRLLGDRTAAEDVTQEVFQKVHRALGQLDPGRDPEPWLATITRNACRDVWRSRSYKMARRSRSLDDPDEGYRESLPSPLPTPEETVFRRERERRVGEAIQKLPESLREVVLLHDYRGFGHDEIAAMLGASHDAVRKRYSRALSRLAGMLKDIL
jgi:RNA polymerase sigma-70 factor (ECF subfamily)